METITQLTRKYLAVAACLTLVLFFGCSRNSNQGQTGENNPGATDTTGNGAGMQRNDSSGMSRNADTTGGMSDQNRSTARRGGNMGENTMDDSQLSRLVRRTLTNDKALSPDAQNVKVSASNGTITLRGPVSTQEMKDNIEAKVKALDGVKSIDNQLQVTNTGQ